jgi:hypothetical protein
MNKYLVPLEYLLSSFWRSRFIPNGTEITKVENIAHGIASQCVLFTNTVWVVKLTGVKWARQVALTGEF